VRRKPNSSITPSQAYAICSRWARLENKTAIVFCILSLSKIHHSLEMPSQIEQDT
jgi:hypothetical protein